MSIPFYKYQGTGNDFVVIDNRTTIYLTRKDTEQIERMCNRRFGIGADGLILLQNHPDYDFEMVYFNSDGRESSMCGNGGRCIVAFAKFLGIFDEKTSFLAIDGPHEGVINPDGNWVELKMGNVETVEKGEGFYYLNTGSPHYVCFVNELEKVDVFQEGRAIRYSERFKKEGTNVNFIQKKDKGIAVATYERGVEDETLSCGTGVTAAAIAYYLEKPDISRMEVPIQAKGGDLKVRFEKNRVGFKEVWLSGPAIRVFEGIYTKHEL